MKRGLDVLVSAFALVVLSPLFGLIGILIKLDSTGPIFFIQERVGKDGKPFLAYQFRTMLQGAVNQGMGLLVERADPRITHVGRFLRRFSIDEVSQLINVLRGEMSLLGPRPTLAYQVEQYDDFQRGRLQVKPGITGWAQIHGRNRILCWERMGLDIPSMDHWSFWLDSCILGRAFVELLRREGLCGTERIAHDLE